MLGALATPAGTGLPAAALPAGSPAESVPGREGGSKSLRKVLLKSALSVSPPVR